MFERILVPLDGSRRAENALPPLDWLASRNGEILLVRSCPLRAVGAVETPVFVPEGLGEARDYLERTAATLRAQGRRVRTLLREGDAPGAVLDAAAEENADLLVLTTHGRTGLSRFVFGSVAEKVLRASPAPVLVFPAFAPAQPEAPRRILVPLESEETSVGVVPALVALARAGKARVLLFHATQEGRPTGDFLQAVAAGLAAEGIEGAAHATEGDPASSILEASRAFEADLLVMATHGRRGPSRWVFGSVTEKVLRAASSPLLVVRLAPLPRAVAAAAATCWKE